MRKTTFIVSVSGVMIAFCLAVAAQAGDCGCGGATPKNYKALCGPPCFSPPGCGSGNLKPGCCECQPTACDNAWDGYCEHKAKVQAFFTQVGTKTGTSRSGCYYANRYGYRASAPSRCETAGECTITSQPATNSTIRAVEPTPAPAKTQTPAPPAPVPEKTTRAKVMYPWAR